MKVCYNRKHNRLNGVLKAKVISVKDLIESINFQPEVIYLKDNAETIRIDYRLLEEEFGYTLNYFLELVPVEGHVFFSNHAWKNETDIHCDTSLLEILKKIDEEQNKLNNQKPSKYLLMVQNALKDLRSGDSNSIMELVNLIEANEEQ